MTADNSLGQQQMRTTAGSQARIAVVVPCYRVRDHIAGVLRSVGPEVWRIYCVDDACPEGSGVVIREAAKHDPRVHLLVHEKNQGVGGAVVTGYHRAWRMAPMSS